MTRCPNCNSQLEQDMELYRIDGAVIGCSTCVEVIYADERYYLEALAQAQQDYMDNALWDRRKDDIC